MHTSSRELLASPAFRRLIGRRWRLSLALTSCLFLLYYGYILLVATRKAWLSQRIGETTTLAMPLGAAVIVGAWALTAIYVAWANRYHDPEVDRLRRQLRD